MRVHRPRTASPARPLRMIAAGLTALGPAVAVQQGSAQTAIAAPEMIEPTRAKTLIEACLVASVESDDSKAPCIGDLATMCSEANAYRHDAQMPCIEAETAQWEALIPNVYDQIEAMIDRGVYANLRPGVEALAMSQKAWLTYRDDECIFQGTVWEVPSDAAETQAYCRLKLTGQRMIDLTGVWVTVSNVDPVVAP